jgi:hypothetical protein
MTGLFALPQEIRDLIYHELWEFTAYVRLTSRPSPGKITYNLIYGAGCNDMSTELPIWLLANRTILQEGLCQLFRHAAWNMGAFRTLDPRVRQNMLVGMSAATNFTIRDTYRVHGIPPMPRPYNIAIDYTHQPIQSMLPLLSANTRTLMLNLAIRTAASRAISMDLSSLCLNGLQIDKLVIQIPLDLWANTAQRCIERYTPFFDNTKTEVLQLGTAWMGENLEVRLQEEVISQLIKPGVIGMGPVGGMIHHYKIASELVRVEESMLTTGSKWKAR